MKSLFSAFLWALISLGVCYVLITVFAGETIIHATVNGVEVEAAVSIDGLPVGVTPYRAHLGAGQFDLEITPPPDAHTHEREWRIQLITLGMGREATAAFTAPVKRGKGKGAAK